MANGMEKRRRPMFSAGHDRLFLAWTLFIHLGALGVFFTFSWKALCVFLFLSWLTGGIGICLGYHRYFTHRSFETPRFFAYVLAVGGALACQAGPIAWVATHRYHHATSDDEKDPHSPIRGFMWAHMGWLFAREEILCDFKSYKNFAADLARDKFLVALDRAHMLPTAVLAAVLYAAGGWPYIVWGLFARLVFVYHITWLVNSASHLWGYRSFETPDRSRNNWWVGLIAFGEGWHNNHHAFPRSARHGMKWWELDTTYWTIKIISRLGLARKICLPARSAPAN
jgi:fatty-acid desaturase